MEKKAEHIYNYVLNKIIEPAIGDDTTFMSDLNDFGKQLFGSQFVGVFASDRIPKLKNKQYCVLNLDKTGESGSHWISVCKVGDVTYVYDSFGRDSKKIIKSIFKTSSKIVDADRDREQDYTENNCGARSMSWLCVVHWFGVELAQLI